MAMTDAKKAEMDAAAAEAATDIPDDDETLAAFRRVAQWWKLHVGGAGHRRLGRLLITYDVVQAGSQSGEREDS